jgi:hypothetical protein
LLDVVAALCLTGCVAGSGTCLITLLVPGGGPTGAVTAKLATETGSAARIKSRETRQNVQDALKVIKQRVQQYAPTAPPNGLALYAGVVDGKMESFVFDQVPMPIKHSLYRCDDHFNVETLLEMTVSSYRTFGYVIMDGNGALVAIQHGPRVRVLQKVKSFIPSKHGKGGQSAMRFAHLRLEQRMMYRKVVVVCVCCAAFLAECLFSLLIRMWKPWSERCAVVSFCSSAHLTCLHSALHRSLHDSAQRGRHRHCRLCTVQVRAATGSASCATGKERRKESGNHLAERIVLHRCWEQSILVCMSWCCRKLCCV